MKPIPTEPTTRRAALGRWRCRRLIAAGFGGPLAVALADDDDVDLHELLVLIDRGCPPALAARILGPIDSPAG